MKNSVSIIVMCGGRGHRLGKLTDEIPKPLIELDGKTILEWKLEHYETQSYENFILCVGYQGDKIRNHLRGKFKNARIHDSGVNVGILRRLKDIKDKMSPISVVTYGDTFATIDIGNLLDKHASNKTLITLVVAPIKNPFGIVNWTNNYDITSFEEKPILNHFIGYFVLNREVFEYIPDKVIAMPDGEGIKTMFQILIAMKQAKAYEYSGLKFTINTPTELEDAKKLIGKYFTIEENNNGE